MSKHPGRAAVQLRAPAGKPASFDSAGPLQFAHFRMHLGLVDMMEKLVGLYISHINDSVQGKQELGLPVTFPESPVTTTLAIQSSENQD